ncbi:MAG: LysM peptidoglycan-binding domain-containing protein [Pseudomonadota bacterium]
MKLGYLSGAAALGVMAGYAPLPAYADQVSDTPAGAEGHTQRPTLQEELVYLRDRMAVQAVRLDEAEQLLQRQARLIELQEEKIAQLEKKLDNTTRMAAALQEGRTYAASSGETYRVVRGDSLSRIAKRKNTTVRALAEANNLRAPYRLKIGQRLTLPGAPQPTRVAQAPATPTPSQKQTQERPQEKSQPTRQASAQQNNRQNTQQNRSPATTQKVEQNRSAPAPQPQRVAQNNQNNRNQQQGTPQQVGQRPQEEEKAPEVEIASDIGGILTPKGSLIVEPTIEMTSSTDNRFFFRGIEIANAVLVGAIDATDTDRRAISSRMGFRYGLTNRLEVDGRVSYIYRDDRVTGFDVADNSDLVVRDLEGSGYGDTEFGLHYQLNRGRKWPFAIANVRVNAPTGRGPFDIERTVEGAETELATGSGYWSIEPSLTFILPVDPAVIFGNIGYQYNKPTSPNAVVGQGATILEFDAGDAVKTSLGVGLSVNDRMNLSFGYDQSYFMRTTSQIQVIDPNTMEVNLANQTQPSTVIGSFLFGGSYAINRRTSINVNTAFGATDGAPDMRVSLRARVRLFD